jgi:uncharacterized SAM-binding protein YcdF (DUF218 family)
MRLLPATRGRRIVSGLIVLLVLFGVLLAELFVFPAVNNPTPADAIVVLGGGGSTSDLAGVHLAEKGLAPLLVFSLNIPETCRPASLHLTVVVRVLCFTAEPQTTQGEAETIRRLAKANNWHRIIVVARTSQVTRARIRVTRCYSGQLEMVGAHDDNLGDWIYGLFYESAALFKAEVLQRGC